MSEQTDPVLKNIDARKKRKKNKTPADHLLSLSEANDTIEQLKEKKTVETTSVTHVLNPSTGRLIKKNGREHKRLIKNGLYRDGSTQSHTDLIAENDEGGEEEKEKQDAHLDKKSTQKGKPTRKRQYKQKTAQEKPTPTPPKKPSKRVKMTTLDNSPLPTRVKEEGEISEQSSDFSSPTTNPHPVKSKKTKKPVPRKQRYREVSSSESDESYSDDSAYESDSSDFDYPRNTSSTTKRNRKQLSRAEFEKIFSF